MSTRCVEIGQRVRTYGEGRPILVGVASELIVIIAINDGEHGQQRRRRHKGEQGILTV